MIGWQEALTFQQTFERTLHCHCFSRSLFNNCHQPWNTKSLFLSQGIGEGRGYLHHWLVPKNLGKDHRDKRKSVGTTKAVCVAWAVTGVFLLWKYLTRFQTKCFCKNLAAFVQIFSKLQGEHFTININFAQIKPTERPKFPQPLCWTICLGKANEFAPKSTRGNAATNENHLCVYFLYGTVLICKW